jgi:hypothetical protein
MSAEKNPVGLLTPAETGSLLGVAPGTLSVWRCTRRYPLNFVKVGGRVKYRMKDIERFLEVQTMEGRAKRRA